MRLLILASYFPKPGNALLGTWALDQAKAFRRTGAEVAVVSLTPWFPRWPGQRAGIRAYSMCPAQAEWDGLTAFYPRWPTYPMAGFERLFRRRPEVFLRLGWSFCRKQVESIVANFRPDVLLAHHTSVNGWIGERLARKFAIPFAAQDHALWEVREYCDLFPAYHRHYRRIAEKACAMFAVSQAMREEMTRVAPAARVHWIPNGADFPLRNAELAARAPVVFSAGMHVDWKGFDILIRAWSTVSKRHPDARLRIGGDGPERSKFLELARDLGVGNSIDFLGYLPHETILAEMRQARAFALTSWKETFGVVFLEAASQGTPLLWCRNAGIADLLQEGIHGYGVPPLDVVATAQALDLLLTDAPRSALMGQTAYTLVRDSFSWDAVVKKAVTVLLPHLRSKEATAP